jgi:hypothetical protein
MERSAQRSHHRSQWVELAEARKGTTPCWEAYCAARRSRMNESLVVVSRGARIASVGGVNGNE